MNVYPVLNAQGVVIGTIALDNIVPNAIMDGQGFMLGGGWNIDNGKFSHYLLTPNPAIDMSTRCSNSETIDGTGSPKMHIVATCTRPINHNGDHSDGYSVWENKLTI